MEENWPKTLEWTLQEERAEVNEDRGWPARYGVDVIRLGQYRGGFGACVDELEELKEDVAKQILRKEWEDVGLDEYPTGLDYFMFDCSLFCGRSVSMGWLGIALAKAEIKGEEDVEVAQRIVHRFAPEDSLLAIAKVAFMRRRRHKSLLHSSRMMPVWTNRVTRVQRRAEHLAAMGDEVLARAG